MISGASEEELELANARADILLLQQENKILRENAEHNDKVVDKVNWENRLLKNRIEKAVKYIENNSLYEEEYDYDYEENIYLSGVNDEKAKNDLLDILEDK